MTILFLDANADTRGPRSEALRQQAEWTVHSVASVSEARSWISRADNLDLLITEAIPAASGETGFNLRDAVLGRYPQAKVLFTTRYDLTGFESQIAGWPVLLDAPYTEAKLVTKAQAALKMPPPPQCVELPPFLAPGTMLGNYQVQDRLTQETESETYRAIQVTVQRPVAMVLLRPDLLSQPEAVQGFKERERLKASISHPRIAPLYEAGSVNGLIFYTRELPRGRNLEEMQAANEHLSEKKIAEMLFGVAEAMQYAVERGYHHRRLYARDIYLDAENQASIVNIFRPASSRPRVAQEEVAALLELVQPLASEGKARGLLATLADGGHDWSGLLEALDDVRDAMRERSIMRRIEAEEGSSASRRPTPWWVWAAAAAALAAVFGLGNLVGTATPSGTTMMEQEMVAIPAGPFIYQKKQTRNLPAFWISKHEVTIGQYNEFLKALEQSATPASFDHPDQPKSKSGHAPAKWTDTYAAAKAGATYNGQPMSLNTPVTQVDWWDAYAFAKWKGQRLPTEEEWEKAARGELGLPFPWGSKINKEAANLGDDYDANGKGGGKDGYNLWAPVDRKSLDVSPYGVCDMAGNVSEWTASEMTGAPWPSHPDYPDLRVPVVRGGHFALKTSQDLLTSRFFAESAMETSLARGFRTASDQAPSAGK
ncbi:formylglycine-generating enzyme required for sulfatase activity [Prosthecobacter fusiformis]|uniref:Formylglycine-generating enzyme required for sulfatase activity n=1 Tax=Prosthecobacter fusiformis TaxID=48464 RepID=A0A4R7SR39_9BACT|nr:SUMF1/EgtB/PvdO family nonheme iron enzyme [Prosthecobacter fusiformis]TDU81742.1 formylglycine-generating enzyme required for sulfatase activity [Prosthecobacter fusiformis]